MLLWSRRCIFVLFTRGNDNEDAVAMPYGMTHSRDGERGVPQRAIIVLSALCRGRVERFRKYGRCVSGPRRCALRNATNEKLPCRLFFEVLYEPPPYEDNAATEKVFVAFGASGTPPPTIAVTG